MIKGKPGREGPARVQPEFFFILVPFRSILFHFLVVRGLGGGRPPVCMLGHVFLFVKSVGVRGFSTEDAGTAGGWDSRFRRVFAKSAKSFMVSPSAGSGRTYDTAEQRLRKHPLIGGV